MSTKIYSAYRIPKDKDVLSLLNKFRNKCSKLIANDYEFLKLVHSTTIAKKAQDLEDNEEYSEKKREHLEKEIREIKRGLFLFPLSRHIEEAEHSFLKNFVDMKFDCAIFYDDNYFYLKFFPNTRWMYDALDIFTRLPYVEDYHYQNSTDMSNFDYQKEPWEEMTKERQLELIEDWNQRRDKWDSLIEKHGHHTFRGGFSFSIFDAFEFKNLLYQNYFKGFKTHEELYSHLKYKFDEFQENTENKEN